MTKSSMLFLKFLRLQITLKNGSVLKTNLGMSGLKWDIPQPCRLLIYWEIRQKTWCILFKTLLKNAPLFLFFIFKDKKLPWLGSVSFQTWHPKVRFEYWTIFEGYLQAEIFKKELLTLSQSLIFNVNSHIFKIKDKNKLK